MVAKSDLLPSYVINSSALFADAMKLLKFISLASISKRVEFKRHSSWMIEAYSAGSLSGSKSFKISL